MTRSSRHRSHRGHKHSARDARERSESEEEREVRDLKAERRKASPGAADVEGAPGEHGRKRKDRGLDVPEAGDRWNGEGSAGAEEKEARGEEFAAYEEERAAKSRSLGAEARSRASRRHEASGSERPEEASAREEMKRRSEREPARREGGGQYGDVKEGERERRSGRDERDRPVVRESVHGKGERERGVEKEKEYVMERERERDRERERERERDLVQERFEKKRDKERRVEGERERHSGRDRSSDGRREKSGYSTTMGSHEEEYLVKMDFEISERSRQEMVYDRGTGKDIKKEIKREEFSERDKWHGDGRKGDDKRTASTEDRTRSGSHYDDKYKDGGSRDKFYEEVDRERRSRNDKYRGDRSSRDYTSDRSESKYYKDLDRPIESRSRNKIQDMDREVTPVTKEYSMKHADNRGKKRSPDYNIEYADVKPRHAKESRTSVDKSALDNYKLQSNDDRGRTDAADTGRLDNNIDRGRTGAADNYKLDSNDDRGKPESIHSNRVELTPSCDHQKNSPILNDHAGDDDCRSDTKHEERLCRSSSKEMNHTSSASSGDPPTVSEAVDKNLESQSIESDVKLKELSQSADCVVDDPPAPSLQDGKTPRSGGNTPAVSYTDGSPSTSDRQNPSRKGSRRSLDDEIGQRGSYTKEGRDHSTKEERGRDIGQGQLASTEAGRASSLMHRTDHITRNFPGHLPPPPLRHGVDSLVQRLGEDDGRGHSGERKQNSHYKRGVDPNMGRGQGGTWNGVPSWTPPVANGFMPFQHGPSGGFISVPQQFPPPIFGVRPFIDFNHGGVPLHMHEPPPDRFSGHVRPFGWGNPSDDSGPPPHMQGWEGNSGMFGNDSNMYVRPEWEHNRHSIGERDWEIKSSSWKGQNAGMNLDKDVDFPSASAEEPPAGQSLSVEKQNFTENHGTKQHTDSRKSTPDSSRKLKDERPPESLKAKVRCSDFCSTYLSKLDISSVLTRPSLYEQCINILQNVDNEVVSSRGTKHPLDQGFNNGIKLVSRSLISTRKPMFPAIHDTIFKNAMSIYNKICGEHGAEKMSEITTPEQVQGCPVNPEVSTPIPVDGVLPGTPAADDNLEKADVESSVNDVLKAKAVKTELVDFDEGIVPSSVVAKMEIDSGNTSSDLPNASGEMEVDSDKISIAAAGVEVIPAGDKACVGIMPECLSRIPNSPKSTH